MVNSVTTKKGTVLPLLNLKGKEYLQVAHRIQWFREDHPDGEIRTELVQTNENFSIFKATIILDGRTVANAHQREDKVDFKDHLAKAETAAIGRALALCGYGTQFAQELEEEHRIVDAPQAAKQVSAPKVTITPKNVIKATEAVITQATAESRARDLAGLFITKGWTTVQAKEYVLKCYSAKSLTDLTLDQAKAFHEVITNSVNATHALSILDLQTTPKIEPKSLFGSFTVQPPITDDDVPF